MLKSTDCVLVMGVRGCGKSYLAKRMQAAWPRRVIIDTLNEYTDNVVYSFFDFTEKLKFYKREKVESFEIVYQFNPEKEESLVEFNEVMRLCFYFGNLLVVIEEVQIFSSSHQLPHWLKQCLLIGRHHNLGLMFTTQRPGELHKTIFSQCQHVFCGRIIEGNDVRYLSTILRQSSDRLTSLPDRRFLYFSTQGVKEISTDA